MTSELSDASFRRVASRGVHGTWLETSNTPSNFKNLVRARMARTGETYQTAARHVRTEAVVLAGPETLKQTVPPEQLQTHIDEPGTMNDEVSINSLDAVGEAHDLLTGEQKKTLREWILAHFKPAKTIYSGTSYGMKQPFTGAGRGPFYVSNDQFKGAMRAAGFDPIDPTDQNWQFRVARKINDPKPGSFLEWLLSHKARRGPLGDLAKDAADDREFPPGELTKDRLLSHLRRRNACTDALEAADSAWGTFIESTTGATEKTEQIAKIRERARQFHIDHVGNYDIVVDATTLLCSAVPKPWYTLSQCGGKRSDKTLPFELPTGSKMTSGKKTRVFIVNTGICTGITTIATGRLSRDEALRFTIAVAGRRTAPGCRSEREGNVADWAWGQMHGGTGVRVTAHRVFDADLAHEREDDVRAAVAAGKYPVVLSIGAKRAAGFAVIEKPVSQGDNR
jgi:hypothetical protein